MKEFTVFSRCECQAGLSAILDEQHHVLTGWAVRLGGKENAPAHSIGADADRFDVAWLCPFCGRNTLRTFYAAALRPAATNEVPAPVLPLEEAKLPPR